MQLSFLSAAKDLFRHHEMFRYAQNDGLVGYEIKVALTAASFKIISVFALT